MGFDVMLFTEQNNDVTWKMVYKMCLKIRDLRSIEIRFESAVPIRFKSHGPIRKLSNRPRLPIALLGRTTQTINGA